MTSSRGRKVAAPLKSLRDRLADVVSVVSSGKLHARETGRAFTELLTTGPKRPVRRKRWCWPAWPKQPVSFRSLRCLSSGIPAAY